MQSSLVFYTSVADDKISSSGKLCSHKGDPLRGTHSHDALITKVVVQLLMQEGAFQFRVFELLAFGKLLQLSITLETDQHWTALLELIYDAGHQELVVVAFRLDGEGFLAFVFLPVNGRQNIHVPSVNLVLLLEVVQLLDRQVLDRA